MYKGEKPPGVDAKHILCLCEHGNNRSVTMAWLLKYVSNFETLTAGLLYHTQETLEMLYQWADVITIPEERLIEKIPEHHRGKVKSYPIGEDHFPRPFNQELLDLTKQLLEKDPIE